MRIAKTKRFFLWDNYGYQSRPLFFLTIPNLSDKQILNLLRWFEVAYGNTEQETPVWALEFEVLTRNLIHSRALVLNPRYLDIDWNDPDIIRGLGGILEYSQFNQYKQAAKLSEEQLLGLCEEGV